MSAANSAIPPNRTSSTLAEDREIDFRDGHSEVGPHNPERLPISGLEFRRGRENVI